MVIIICNTCDKALQSNRMPCQAVTNKLFLEDLPKQFQGINRLERLLASRRILIKKVIVIPKGKSLKMEGSICNIPVTEVDVNCNTLPGYITIYIQILKLITTISLLLR